MEREQRTYGWVKFLIGALIVLAILGVNAGQSWHNSQPRHLGTDEIRAGYTRVSASVVAFEPVYTVSNIMKRGLSEVTMGYDVLCQCRTAEGTEFWLLVDEEIYLEEIAHQDSREAELFGYMSVYPDEPVLVNGRMKRAEDTFDGSVHELSGELVMTLTSLQDGAAA